MFKSDNFHFFIDNDVVTWVVSNIENDEIFKGVKSCKIELDFIEQPFYSVVTVENGDVEVEIYIRNELGVFLGSPDIRVKFCVGIDDFAKALQV